MAVLFFDKKEVYYLVSNEAPFGKTVRIDIHLHIDRSFFIPVQS